MTWPNIYPVEEAEIDQFRKTVDSPIPVPENALEDLKRDGEARIWGDYFREAKTGVFRRDGTLGPDDLRDGR